MPFEKTEKIWMNGELIPWDDAQIHVLTHSLHYGMGVFEGIRAYETQRGTAVFRLSDHLNRFTRSAKLYEMDLAHPVEELAAAVHDTVAVGEGERGRHAGTDLCDLARREPLRVAQDGRERPAVDELHHDEVGAVIFAPVEDRHDVGVREVGCGLRLPSEAFDEGLVNRELREEDLERDGAVELPVHGAVDLRHATSSHQMRQLVAA